MIGKAPGRTMSINNSQTRGAVERLALVGDGSQTPMLMNGKVSNLNHIARQGIGEIAFLLSRASKREVLAKTLPTFGTTKNLVMITTSISEACALYNGGEVGRTCKRLVVAS